MAFSLRVSDYLVEYRNSRSGTSSKTGNPWLSLVCEDSDGNQLNISVPSDVIADVINLGLRKGDYCRCDLLAVARADGSSYLMLQTLPRLEYTEVL